MALCYAIPAAGVTWTQILFTNYIFKYSVDVLGIAAATIGWILLVTRLWDAVSDPMVGYLSDRTRSPAGRRRPWLFGSVVPVALTAYVMWNPPRSLDADELFWWMFVSVALWETAMTTLYVPYVALGSEITMGHHDRTRVAGYRHIFGGIGQVCMLGSVYLLTHAGSISEQRDVAGWLIAVGATISAALIAGGIWGVRERPEHRDRGARNPLRALRDVVRNRHLMQLALVYFFEISSVAAISLLAPFVCQYVVGDAGLIVWLLGLYSFASYVATPPMVTLSRKFGKKPLWIATMAIQVIGFATTLLAGPGDGTYLTGCLVIVGLGSAGGLVLGMSILADTVDYGELQSGERKEALHYAIINIARKSSFAAVSAAVGLSMQWIGYVPNAEQSPDTIRGLSALFAGIPSLAMFVAILLLSRFRLDEAEHARVRRELDAQHRVGERPENR
jgi:GPH family glycoside/pentoside/hexuronide:cation symporter